VWVCGCGRVGVGVCGHGLYFKTLFTAAMGSIIEKNFSRYFWN